MIRTGLGMTIGIAALLAAPAEAQKRPRVPDAAVSTEVRPDRPSGAARSELDARCWQEAPNGPVPGGGRRCLNPQPLPPRDAQVGTALGQSRAAAQALNPQPLPPRDATVGPQISSGAAAVSLNPQPLPPRETTVAPHVTSGAAAVSLNPQPLPPEPDPER